nr:NlpC/P60 family protein [uncultured Butyrivibrio sp.]
MASNNSRKENTSSNSAVRKGLGDYQDWRQKLEQKPEQTPVENHRFTGMKGNEFTVGAQNQFSEEETQAHSRGRVDATEGNIRKASNDGRIEITSGNIPTRNGSVDASEYSTGALNRFKKGENKLGEMTYDTVKSQYGTTEASQGKKALDKASRFVGHGGIYKGAAKRELAYKLYNRNKKNLPADSIIDSGKYRIGDYHTGNVVNDYHNNMKFIVGELDKTKVNVTKLTSGEVSTILRTGHYTKGFKKVNFSDEQLRLLKEFQYLKGLEGAARQIGGSQGKFGTMASAYTDATIGDSDFKQGLDFTKKTVGTTKLAAKAGREATAFALKGSVNAASLGARAVTGMTELQYKAIYKATGNANAKVVADKAARINNSIKNGTVKVTDGIQKATHVDKVAKGKIRGAVDNFKLKHFQKLSALRDKLLDNKLMRTVGKPFSAVNAVKRALFKGTIFVGLALLVIFLLVPMLVMIISALPDIMDFDPTKDETVADTTAQKAINYLYSFQEAYTENAFECRTDTEQGRIWAEKRLPESWIEQIQGSDSTIINENNNAAVYYDGALAGFNFNKYWGQRAWVSGGGEDSYGNKPVYVTTVSDTWPVGGDDGYTDYETHSVTLKFYGNAGLTGNIGSYTMPLSVYDCYLSNIDELEFNINGNSENPGTEETEAYTLWESDEYVNPDVDCTFTYMGSKYSFNYTEGKYSYYYDTEGGRKSYTIDDFYKSFLTIVMGFSDNGREDAEFTTLYAKEIFDAVMENATVSMHYEYEREDKEDNLTMKINSPDGEYNVASNDYYNCKVFVDVIINDSGLMDLMYQDTTLEVTERDGSTWTHNGEVGNEWVHSSHAFYNIENATYEEVSGVKSNHAYKQTNPNSSKGDYRGWYNESQGEGTTPLWGMSKPEYEDRNTLVQHTFYDGIERTYSSQMESMIEAYNLSVKDWESFVEGLMFPSGWARMLSDGEIIRALVEARENGLNVADFENYEDWLQFALATVGRFGYAYGAGHGIDWRTYNGNRFDCSGFISYLLQQQGKLAPNEAYGCSGLMSHFGSSSYSGDPSSLKPGDLVILNGKAGEKTTSENHVKMFLGYLQLDGDSEPKPYFIECASKKGVVISSGNCSGYSYKVSP